MKKIRLTRKVQLSLLGTPKERQDNYTKLFQWNTLVYRAANQVASHLFFQSKQSEFSYLSNSARLILLDEKIPITDVSNVDMRELLTKDAVALLNTSRQNSTYKILSEKYKGKLPSDIFNNINSNVTRIFNAESEFYYNGERSLRSYKKGLPIPFSIGSIKGLRRSETGNEYTFTLFGIPFQTFFGKDSSKNREKFDLVIQGHIKMCSSSLQIIGKKIYLLAVFETHAEQIDGDGQMAAELAEECVIRAKFKDRVYTIGSREEFTYQMNAINLAKARAKAKAASTRGGRGKKHKLGAIEEARKKSNNFWNTKMHAYSKELIDLCSANRCSCIVLLQPAQVYTQADSTAEGDNSTKRLLPNWSFHGLREKIEYKSNRLGIKVVVNTGDFF